MRSQISQPYRLSRQPGENLALDDSVDGRRVIVSRLSSSGLFGLGLRWLGLWRASSVVRSTTHILRHDAGLSQYNRNERKTRKRSAKRIRRCSLFEGRVAHLNRGDEADTEGYFCSESLCKLGMIWKDSSGEARRQLKLRALNGGRSGSSKECVFSSKRGQTASKD